MLYCKALAVHREHIKIKLHLQWNIINMNQKYGLPIISADIKIRGEKILKDDVLSLRLLIFPTRMSLQICWFATLTILRFIINILQFP